MNKISLLFVSLCLVLSGCSKPENTVDINDLTPTESPSSLVSVNEVSTTEAFTAASPDIEETEETDDTQDTDDTHEVQAVSLINPDGMSIRERFQPPEGFIRLESEKDSFADFLQALPLKPDGSKVNYFDGREKTRDVYMAVVDYTLGDRDLQQCADAVMRLRAEYLYAIGKHDEIKFNFVNGFTADFSKWADGHGISVDGNNVSWFTNSQNNSSYESFQKYLTIVYAYSSTLSLDNELVSKNIEDIAIGDVFIIGGSPGHCVIVVDMAINEVSGEKAFMLAQSYMPAQDIHILKSSVEGSPWYSDRIEENLITPEWTFEITQLKTWE